jgi:predicted amidohydrolase
MSSLSFSLIQPPLAWEDKAANLAHLGQLIDGITAHTEVVVLPEMFSTGFSMRPESLAETMEGATVKWMREWAHKKRIILTGSVIIESGGRFYNRLLWVLPDQTIGYYDKRHRFAFAGEDEKYTSGSKRLIAQVKGWKINLQVCYDLRFPVWARQQTVNGSPEYDVLIYVANWPERRSHAWKTLLMARAIENQCYVIGVNRVGNDGNGIYHSGDSMVIDPLGEILFHRTHEETVHTFTLDKEKLDDIRSRFPFWKDADHFHISQS